MNDPLSLFESENNPLKDSMRQILEQLPNNSEQVKSVFKSLLLVHISKIKDPEERSTWQSFINTIDNFSHSEDQAMYSFGPLSNSNLSKNIKEILKEEGNFEEISEIQYSKNIKLKAINNWKVAANMNKKRTKALKSVMLIALRLKYIESFWKWQMLSSGLDKIALEFYSKNLSNKMFWAWRKFIKKKDKNINGYIKAHKYWITRTLLIVLINWTAMLRDSYKLKGITYAGIQKTNKMYRDKSRGITSKSPLVGCNNKSLEKNYFKQRNKN